MDHHHLIRFFAQAGIMLAAALVCGQFMRRLRQPRVLGELIGGVLLGPTVFGALWPDKYTAVFPPGGPVAAAMNSVISVGMLFFLFVAGLEVKLGRLARRGRTVALTSFAGIAIPFLFGALSVWFFPRFWGDEALAMGGIFVLFIGAALSISALPVIARIFIDLELIDRPIGVVVLTAATIDDLIGWSLFTVVLGSFVPGGAERSLGATLGLVALFAAVLVGVGRWLGEPALRWLRRSFSWPSGFIGVTVVLIFLAAAVAEAIGIHAIFGAFLVGVALGQGVEENEAHEIIYQFALSFFAPLYFVSVGLKANFARAFDWELVLFVLVVACAGKILGAAAGAWLGGMRPREAWAVGFGMNARGAMEMILATVALQYGVIDERLFVALIVMALVTSLLSGPVVGWLMADER